MLKQFRHNLDRVQWVYSFFLQTYRYRVELTHAYGAREKLPHLVQSLWRTFIDRKRIFFYPDSPLELYVLFKMLRFLGYRYTSDPERTCDLAIKWWVALDGNPFAPETPIPQPKNNRRNAVRVLNSRCNDVSKARVNAAFEETFGYSVSIDPRTHKGKCVMKANWNALHVGEIIECPTEPKEGDFVYQKLIRNEVDDELVEDMRVPIFGNRTPFVYLKYRPVKDRFVDRPHINKRANKKAKIVELTEVLSGEELNNIYRFCERMGFEYGELDVLRDKDDGRIYIVDANNTPSGPTSTMSENDRNIAVVRLAQAFREAFGV